MESNTQLKLKPPASASSNKYPATCTPNDSWTIEQLLFWSLDQYHSAAISKTNSHLGALRLQCENECEDVLMLHELAVQMMSKRNSKGDGDANDDDATNIADTISEENIEGPLLTRAENVDPQQQQQQQQGHHVQHLKQPATTATTTAAAITTSSSSSIKPKSSNNNNNTLLIITILSGPHASQTYKIHPKHTQPCLVGRSKGKKFLRNGISLSKDQEVSTTHGKFSVEEEEVVLDHHHDHHESGDHNNDDDGNTYTDNNHHDHGGRYCNDNQGQGTTTTRVQKKFYYTDIGSTNGSTVGEARLEANVRVEIEEGMELRIGNSTLKIVFG